MFTCVCNIHVFVRFTVAITCESCVIACLVSTRVSRARHVKNPLIELITTEASDSRGLALLVLFTVPLLVGVELVILVGCRCW